MKERRTNDTKKMNTNLFAIYINNKINKWEAVVKNLKTHHLVKPFEARGDFCPFRRDFCYGKNQKNKKETKKEENKKRNRKEVEEERLFMFT